MNRDDACLRKLNPPRLDNHKLYTVDKEMTHLQTEMVTKIVTAQKGEKEEGNELDLKKKSRKFQSNWVLIMVWLWNLMCWESREDTFPQRQRKGVGRDRVHISMNATYYHRKGSIDLRDPETGGRYAYVKACTRIGHSDILAAMDTLRGIQEA